MINSEIYKKWKHFHKNFAFRENLRSELKYSWERSYSSGVDPYLRYNPYILTKNEFVQAREASQYLLKISETVISDLYEFVAGTGFVVALADCNKCILKIVGNKESVQWAKDGSFVESSLWSENLVGTNAGALCHDLGKPVSVYGYEHFCLFSHPCASSCAPIIDQDTICGFLAMLASCENVNSHTLGMVVTSANHIISKMALDKLNKYYKMVMESMSEGVLVLDPNGKVTYMNANCSRILKLPNSTSTFRNISTLLDNNVENNYFINKITQGRTIIDENFTLVTHNNEHININITCNSLAYSNKTNVGTVVIINETQRIKHLVGKWVGGGAKFTFDTIIGKDPRFVKVLKTAKAASSSSSNVLLLGESGTGKDVIAQAMHNASSRRNYPYVAINCAALPRDLIASELFGYEEGAFTGARKGGNIGKFELAEQGTIFLDEIGDMPLDLQASLLRVLEEKSIVRLGSNKLIPINVRIIAATNKNLKSEIERNRFRHDLYYRLAVIKLTIPPLRERPHDIILLAEELIELICHRLGKPPMTLSSQALEALMQYEWPGNIRELQNLLEGSIQFAPDSIITYNLVSDYLPNTNIKQEINSSPPVQHLNPPSFIDEKQTLLDYLSKYKYNKSEVAKAMGISRKTLYKYLNKHGI